MTAVYEVFLAAAIAFVATQGSIFKPIREVGPKIWRDLATCPLCTGVWIGGGLHALFADFPQLSNRLGTARFAAELLGLGSLAGVLALLAVSLWDWLAKDPGIRIESGATLMYLTKPTIGLGHAETAPAAGFVSEAPTEPTAPPESPLGDKLTQRIPVDKLRAKRDESRRSKP